MSRLTHLVSNWLNNSLSRDNHTSHHNDLATDVNALSDAMMVKGATFPYTPVAGDTWLKTDTGETFYYTGSYWQRLSTVVGSVAPSAPREGDLWADTANGNLLRYRSGAWRTAGPHVGTSFPYTPASGDSWIDTAKNLLKVYLGTRWLIHTPPAVDVRAFTSDKIDQSRFLTACATTAGSLVVNVDSGALTGEEVGWMFEIVSAGAPDSMAAPGPGRQNWQGIVASVNAPANQFTAVALPPANPAAAAPTAQNPTASGLRGVIAQPCDTAFAAAFVAAAAIGAKRVYVPGGNYYTQLGIYPPSNMVLEGAGVEQTIIRSGTTAPGIQINAKSDVQVFDLTVEGAGPHGGTTGAAGSVGCFDVKNSVRVRLTRCRARYGAVGFAVREQASDDVVLTDCTATDITTSNGVYSTAATNGIGFWFFNGVKHVRVHNISAIRCDRHGIYYDPGTSSLTGPTEHGHLDYCSGSQLYTEDTGRMGVAGVPISLQGARWGNFTGLTMIQHGKDPNLGTYSALDGFSLGGDQNGEYTQHTNVSNVLLKDMGGIPLILFSAVRSTVRGVRIDDFNKAQLGALPAIQFQSYGGFTATNVLAGPDNTDCTVDGVDIRYSGSAGNFTNAVVFSGGLAVPDGASGTRTAKTLRNHVRNCRFVDASSKPSSAMATWSGGSTNCPSEGSDANWVGELHVYEQTGTYVRQLAIQGNAFANFKQRADGRMEWGPGNVATDTNLYRGSGVANQLKTDDLLWAVDGVATKTKAGTPADGDFQTTPPDGAIVVDTTANKIWVRVGGTWKSVVVA
jgi:hypothetical protein